MNNNSPPPPDQNLPVPVQQTTAVGRPAGSGRNPPAQSWQTGEPEAVPWGQYLDALRRRWWVVLLVAVAGSYLGRLYSKTIPAEYTTQTKIFVSPAGSDPSGPITVRSILTTVTLQDMVKTPAVVAPVVRRLRLNVHHKQADAALFQDFALDSVFSPGAYRLAVDSTGRGYVLTQNPRSESPQQEVGVFGGSVGRQFGFQWVPSASQLRPKQLVDFSVSEVIYEALFLTGKLTTGFNLEGGQILTLTLTTNDKETIAPTLNEWAREFIDQVTEVKRVSLTERRRTIEQQLGHAEGQLRAAQRSLQDFRERNGYIVPDAQGATSLALQKTQLDQVRRDREKIAAVLRTAGSGQIDEGPLFGSTAIMGANPQLSVALADLTTRKQALDAARQDFTESSLQVQKARALVRASTDTIIPDILRDIDRNFADQDSTLSKEVGSRSDELAQIPRKTFEGAERQRDYDAAVKLVTDLSESYQHYRLAAEQTSADLTIVGEAIPPLYPSSSPGPRLYFLSIVASIGLGLALALLLDRLDRRFRYPQQATMELGLTIAGTIPFFKPNRKGELNLAASSQVVESFRTLRLATQFHFPPGEPVVVCISSPGPGEGKSLIASNLAVAFANAGQKTLLIDGDVRRGVVHTTFTAERRPGLVDYLGGTATSAQAIRPTSTDHLFIMPSGSRSRRAPELLVSDRMAGLIAEMRSQYEVIIVDSAPFVAGMDAFALGAAAGTALIVLRPGVTDRKLAENKLEILDRLPVTIIGAVLNAISGGRAYRYYSDYATYEGEDDMVDEADFDQAAPPDKPNPPHQPPLASKPAQFL